MPDAPDNHAFPRQYRHAISTPVAIVCCIVALVAASALGVVAAGDNVLAWDLDITIAVQEIEGTVLDALTTFGNTVGATLTAAILISLALLAAAALRAWPQMAHLAILLVLRLAGTQLKPIFDSPRPTEDLVLVTGIHDGTGYPSGHAMTGATMALGLAVLAWRHIPSRPLATAAVGLLVLVALVIGWARVYSGAHWPTDVLGGWLFGIAIVAVGIVFLNRLTATDAQG